MKAKAFLLLCVFSVVCAVPGYGQGRGHHYGRGHGRGNPHTDKQGTDKQGPKDRGDQDDDGDDDDGDDFDFAALRARTAEVVASLSTGTMTTSDGAAIPISAQGKLYVVLTNSIMSAENPPAVGSLVSASGGVSVDASDANTPSVSRFVLALSASGTGAQSKLVELTRSLTGLAYDPARIPKAVASFNDFVDAASPEFLANPTAEFVALHAVLQKLSKGLPQK